MPSRCPYQISKPPRFPWKYECFLFSEGLPFLSSALCVTHGRPKGLLKLRAWLEKKHGLVARSTQHLAHSTEHLAPSTQHLATNAQHTAPGTLAPGTQHLAPSP